MFWTGQGVRVINDCGCATIYKLKIPRKLAPEKIVGIIVMVLEIA